jgi:glyoxylase-like metal-dependent hydrolase (beta-lactamase superfamily II)
LIIESQELISDRLAIDLSPGHTPGSITLRVSHRDQTARFCGDICHHPLQVYEPWMNSAYCQLPEQAIATRHSLLETCAEDNALLMPAHFGPSHAARVHRRGSKFSLSWC